ncbi:MAG TPA: AAA family ATPase [Aldersonia sp.]
MTPERIHIERLRIQNYRALRDVTFKELTPFTVLCGPNGSGKSTVFDVFAFLNEAFTEGLRSAWDARNRMTGIRSRGSDGPIGFELEYRAPGPDGQRRLVTYTLRIGESSYVPVIEEEKLQWTTSPGQRRPREILSFSRGAGFTWDEDTGSTQETLSSPDLLAVSALGQFARHPRVQALRDFISGWYLSYISADSTRVTPMAGSQPRLSQTGDNLPNVIQYLDENHQERLEQIFNVRGERVPQLERLIPERMADGRLLLTLKDRAFDEPVLSRFASDGTLKLLAYLTVIYDPDPPAVIGIEEPENLLHPKLLAALADEMRGASAKCQILVTTHSPEFVNMVKPRELWMIRRGDDGYARVARASDDDRLMAMVAAGGQLGALWNEGYLSQADPQQVVVCRY